MPISGDQTQLLLEDAERESPARNGHNRRYKNHSYISKHTVESERFPFKEESPPKTDGLDSNDEDYSRMASERSKNAARMMQ